MRRGKRKKKKRRERGRRERRQGSRSVAEDGRIDLPKLDVAMRWPRRNGSRKKIKSKKKEGVVVISYAKESEPMLVQA